eukprot:4177904-Amphidinium_carterae.1
MQLPSESKGVLVKPEGACQDDAFIVASLLVSTLFPARIDAVLDKADACSGSRATKYRVMGCYAIPTRMRHIQFHRTSSLPFTQLLSYVLIAMLQYLL